MKRRTTSSEPCNCTGAVDSCNDDTACLEVASTDKLGLEAIRSLHQQLDDDANGNIDLTESDDVCILESPYISDYINIINTFCKNDKCIDEYSLHVGMLVILYLHKFDIPIDWKNHL